MIDVGIGRDMPDTVLKIQSGCSRSVSTNNPWALADHASIQNVVVDEYIYLFDLTMIKVSILFTYQQFFFYEDHTRRCTDTLADSFLALALVYTIVASLKSIPQRR